MTSGLVLLAMLSSQGRGESQPVLRLEDIMPLPQPHHNITYDKSAPPMFRHQPAIVFLHITVLMMDSFDQNEMTFTTGETCQPARAGQLVTRHVPGPHLEGPQTETAQVRGGGHLQDPGRQVDTTHLETGLHLQECKRNRFSGFIHYFNNSY